VCLPSLAQCLCSMPGRCMPRAGRARHGGSPHRNSAASKPGAPCENASSGSHASINTILERETLQSAARASRQGGMGGADTAGSGPTGGPAALKAGAPPPPPLCPPSVSGSAAMGAEGSPDPNCSTRSAASTPCSSEAASACPAPTAACRGVGLHSGIPTSPAPHCSSSSRTDVCPPRAAAISAPCGDSATWGQARAGVEGRG
jgi:hypothetical protein